MEGCQHRPDLIGRMLIGGRMMAEYKVLYLVIDRRHMEVFRPHQETQRFIVGAGFIPGVGTRYQRFPIQPRMQRRVFNLCVLSIALIGSLRILIYN